MRRRLLAVLALVTFGLAACSSPATVTHHKTSTPLRASASLPKGLLGSGMGCTTDVSAALNAWLASRPSNSTVTLPYHACYIVSNTTSGLLIQSKTGLTINGNGATFMQTSYGDNMCDADVVQPILTLKGNTNLTFRNFTIQGPGICGGGGGFEGGIGIFLSFTGDSTSAVGNTNVTFSGVTVEHTVGDGMDVYPQLGKCCGINRNISFINGGMNHIGYHAFVPEGVKGWLIQNNTFTSVGNFMDVEVDNPYGPPYDTCDEIPDGLSGNAQCDISILNNRFVDGSTLEVQSVSDDTCQPQGYMKINNNTVDATSTLFLQLDGSSHGGTPTTCPQDNNLQIENNHSVMCAPPVSSYTGCGESAGGEALVQIATWKNVTVSGNQFLGFTGSPQDNPNNLFTECVAVAQSANVTIKNNSCNNTNNVWDHVSLLFPPNSSWPDTTPTACGNVYWLTLPIVEGTTKAKPPADPKHDSSC